MTEINICTLNCRGLGDYRKRRDVFHYLRRSDYHIYFLQDIHCERGKENIFRNAWGTDILIAPYRCNARGVAILTKGIKITFCEVKVDEGGNYIIAKCNINDSLKIVLVNVYGPNNDNPKFYEEIGEMCEEIGGGDNIPVVIGGDYNIALNGMLDTVNYVRENSVRAREMLLKLMDENGWVDIFRERNGNKKRYTWRNTGSVIKQARLDYFIISRALIPHILEEKVLPGYRTDHSMVTLKIDIQKHTRGKGFFKINNSLMKSEDYCEKIRQTITDTLLTYALPVYMEEFIRQNQNQIQVNISWSLFWETLILNLRTATVSFAIHRKRTKNLEERNYIKEIEELEGVVQNRPDRETITALETAKENLEQIRREKLDGIITRSRVKWHEQGERSNAYFLGLERRGFSNKLIASLEDGESGYITVQSQIMHRLVEYFTEMFRERPREQQTELFMNDVHIKQISDREKCLLEQPITLSELEAAIKRMSKNKSPGSDGFSVEFYQCFWGDLKTFFYNMVKESVETAALPMTLREGILTLVPKPNRPGSEIKSYRPITLLNVSYKIIATAIANKIRKVLPTIIDQDQTGFMKGRFIGDNTRLTYDLIQELKKEKRSALFVSLDIEDAFNAVDWEFARKVMRKRNFPETILSLFNMLYVGSYSRLVYNGHISDRIMLERSCRQGDPLSPYIFLIVIECALEIIRQNNNIKGIQIGDVEYKLSAYADDVLCYLDGSINSCRALFHDLGIFAKYSGLKPNIAKTQAFWAGMNNQNRTISDTEFNFKWTKKLKVLGVVFTNEEGEAYEENFESKMKMIQSIMNSWNRRYITVRGKITLIKCLLLPKLTHILVSLPKPTTEFMKRLKNVMFHFIWGAKVDRLRRLSICKPYSQGGLAMVEVDAYIEALKATWVRREIHSNHSWTLLFYETISKGRCLWERNSDSLKKLAKEIPNPFWSEVCRSFANVSRGLNIDTENINRCGLWHSDVTKYRTSCISSWRKRGLYYISDIINELGTIKSFQEIKQNYLIDGSYLDYMGLVGSLPRQWKSMPRKARAEYPIIHPQVELALSKEKGAKYLYNVILHEKTKTVRNSWELAWEIKYGIIDWPEIYRSIHQKSSVQSHILNYKIITRIVATKKLLYIMRIANSPICSRCDTYVETVEHKFWLCNEVNQFWKGIARFLHNHDIIRSLIVFNSKKIIFGEPNDIIINRVISTGKNMIMKQTSISVELFIVKFKFEITNEKCIAQSRGDMVKFRELWGRLDDALAT